MLMPLLCSFRVNALAAYLGRRRIEPQSLLPSPALDNRFPAVELLELFGPSILADIRRPILVVGIDRTFRARSNDPLAYRLVESNEVYLLVLLRNI